MKTLIAIGMLLLALSFCNLGRRKANNSNSNTSGTNTGELGTSSTPMPGKKPTPPPISAGVVNGKAIKLVQPPYPPIAKSAHVSGRVTVEVFIDENGDVFYAAAVSGDPLLQAAAIVAARQSKFTPTILAGKPVKVTGVVVYNFVGQ